MEDQCDRSDRRIIRHVAGIDQEPLSVGRDGILLLVGAGHGPSRDSCLKQRHRRLNQRGLSTLTKYNRTCRPC